MSIFKYLKIIPRFQQFLTAAISHVVAQHPMPREVWDRPRFQKETVGASGHASGLGTVSVSGHASGRGAGCASFRPRSRPHFRRVSTEKQSVFPAALPATFPPRNSRLLRSSISGRVSGPRFPAWNSVSYLGRQRRCWGWRTGSISQWGTAVDPVCILTWQSFSSFVIDCEPTPIHGVTLFFFVRKHPFFLGSFFLKRFP